MRNIKKIISILLITIILSFGLISCGTKEEDVAKGYLWKASKGDVTLYLIGTMHPAPESTNFFNDEVNKILKKTDVLSVEADVTNTEQLATSQSLLINRSEDTAKTMLTEDELHFLELLLSKTGLNRDGFNILTPAGIVSLVESGLYSDEQYTTSFDEQLINYGKNKNITINELESIEFQLDLLNNLYTWQDVKDSIETFKNPTSIKESKDYLLDTFKAYEEGDVEYLENDIKNMKTEKPDFYDKLVTQRNITMAKNIDILVKDGKTHTIAVGCKHFIGEDSILIELEKLGYTITKL